MSKWYGIGLPLFLFCVLVSCATPVTKPESPTILVAAFGSSYESGQKNLGDFDEALRQVFPENPVYWGFTSNFIVEALRKKGDTSLFDSQVPLWKIDEAFVELKKQGITNVLVVNLLIMPGGEYREAMLAPTQGLNVKYVHSLLFYPQNIQNAVLALQNQIADDARTATVFCAHGNEKHLQYNGELEEMDAYLRSTFQNTYLVSMEGLPTWAPVRQDIMDSGVEAVHFVPFMLTYGDHMSNDVMGDSEDSFQSQLGLPATTSQGLASEPAFQKMYFNEIDRVLTHF